MRSVLTLLGWCGDVIKEQGWCEGATEMQCDPVGRLRWDFFRLFFSLWGEIFCVACGVGACVLEVRLAISLLLPLLFVGFFVGFFFSFSLFFSFPPFFVTLPSFVSIVFFLSAPF